MKTSIPNHNIKNDETLDLDNACKHNIPIGSLVKLKSYLGDYRTCKAVMLHQLGKLKIEAPTESNKKPGGNFKETIINYTPNDQPLLYLGPTKNLLGVPTPYYTYEKFLSDKEVLILEVPGDAQCYDNVCRFSHSYLFYRMSYVFEPIK